jgi:signal transduction histidine kinase
VRRIAARHRGSFSLTSDPAKGTAATLTIPAARSATSAPPEKE